MVERGGDIVTQVVTSCHRKPMERLIQANVLPGTTVATDEFGSYRGLSALGYEHMTVNHNKGQYASSNGASTNQIESFWRHLKCSIAGTHISLSPKYVATYAKEFEYRFNRRHAPASMLPELLSTFGPLTTKRD